MGMTAAVHPSIDLTKINGPILTVLIGTWCPYMIMQADGRDLCGTHCILHDILEDPKGKPAFSAQRAAELIIKAVEDRQVAVVMFQGHEVGHYAREVLTVAEACAQANIVCTMVSRIGLGEHSARFAELGGYWAWSVDRLKVITQPQSEISVHHFLSVSGAKNRLMVNTVLDTETLERQLMIPAYASRLGVEFLLHSPKLRGLHRLAVSIEKMKPIRDAMSQECKKNSIKYHNGNEFDQSAELANQGQLGASVRKHPHPFYRIDFAIGRMGIGYDEIIKPVHEQRRLDPDISELPLVA